MESENAVRLSQDVDLINLPDLLTEEEVIQVLRIPQVSKAKDYYNVIRNLIRFDDLPRIQICKHNLYPKKAILEWIGKKTIGNSLDL